VSSFPRRGTSIWRPVGAMNSPMKAGGSGVFTKNLIEVLNRSQGGVTYYELRGRLKNYIKNQFRQTPQIYEAGGSQEIYRTFLNKKEAGKPLFGMISHNSKDGWILDMGAIHGLSNQAKKVKVSAEDESEVFEAKIGKIESSWTEVLFEENDAKKLDKNEVYYGSIEGFLSAPIQVYLNNFDRDEEAKKRLKDLIEEKGKNLFFTEDEKGADYTVQMAFGRYHITEPEDIFRPLVMPTEDNSKEAAELAFSHLNHISQWEYVKNLENNGDNQLPRDAIKVEVFKVIKDEAGQEQLELLSFTGEDEILTSLEKKGNEYESTFRIKLTNMSSYKLWVSFIYLYKDFSADPEWFANLVQELEPREAHQEEGGSVWVLEDQPNIYFGLEDSTRIFNWAEDVSYFKVIASRQEFDVRQLKMEGLPDPAKLADAAVADKQGPAGRGIQRKRGGGRCLDDALFHDPLAQSFLQSGLSKAVGGMDGNGSGRVCLSLIPGTFCTLWGRSGATRRRRMDR
jgi:hypothetical protein